MSQKPDAGWKQEEQAERDRQHLLPARDAQSRYGDRHRRQRIDNDHDGQRRLGSVKGAGHGRHDHPAPEAGQALGDAGDEHDGQQCHHRKVERWKVHLARLRAIGSCGKAIQPVTARRQGKG